MYPSTKSLPTTAAVTILVGFALVLVALVAHMVILVISPVGVWDYIRLSDTGLFVELFKYSPVGVVATLVTGIVGSAVFATGKTL